MISVTVVPAFWLTLCAKCQSYINFPWVFSNPGMLKVWMLISFQFIAEIQMKGILNHNTPHQTLILVQQIESNSVLLLIFK